MHIKPFEQCFIALILHCNSLWLWPDLLGNLRSYVVNLDYAILAVVCTINSRVSIQF